jgi:hypothetical protein
MWSSDNNVFRLWHLRAKERFQKLVNAGLDVLVKAAQEAKVVVNPRVLLDGGVLLQRQTKHSTAVALNAPLCPPNAQGVGRQRKLLKSLCNVHASSQVFGKYVFEHL